MNKTLGLGLGLALGLALLCSWGLLAGQARRADERMALLAVGRIAPTAVVLEGSLQASRPGGWLVAESPAYLLLRVPALLAVEDLTALSIRGADRPALLRIDCAAQVPIKIDIAHANPAQVVIPTCQGRTLGLWLGPGRAAEIEIELTVDALRRQAALDLRSGRSTNAPTALSASWAELLTQPRRAAPRQPSPPMPVVPTLPAIAAAVVLGCAALMQLVLRSKSGRWVWIVAMPLPLLLVRDAGDAQYPLLLLFVLAVGAAIWPRARDAPTAARSGNAELVGWAVAGVACAALIVHAATQSGGSPKLTEALRYLVFAALQQTWLLAGVLRAAPADDDGQRVVWASAAMALAHWPNPLLMALTAVLAMLTSTLYLRGAGLGPLALIHASTGLAAQAWFSALSLRAGWNYLDG